MKAILVLAVAYCFLMLSEGNPTPQEKPTQEANSISITDFVEERFGTNSILFTIHHNHNFKCHDFILYRNTKKCHF